MSVVTATSKSWGRAMTVAELDALPDDGRRHELLDGTLVVTPAPAVRHQVVSEALLAVMRPLVPGGLRLLHAPLDVRVDDHTNLQPDILVARRVDFTEANLPVAPLLAVEILSPSTRHLDLGAKKAKYEELGTAHYWVVDPVDLWVTAWELHDGAYAEAGHAEADDALVLERPFPVRIVPAGLIT